MHSWKKTLAYTQDALSSDFENTEKKNVLSSYERPVAGAQLSE